MAEMSSAARESFWRTGKSVVPSDLGPLPESAQDLVIGSGITGLATAVLLARAGRSVVVIEARSVGAVTTGSTTGKISLLQGTRLSGILRRHGKKVTAAYLESNQAGKAWLESFCATHGVATQTRDAYTYAASGQGMPSVQGEHEACARLGLDAVLVDVLDVPFPHAGAVRLAGQTQFDAMAALGAMAADLAALGGQIFQGVRACGLDAGTPNVVRIVGPDGQRGELRADNVIVATGIPFLDRGLYFAKVIPQRSYALAARVPGLAPMDMYLSVDGSGHSIRTAPTADGVRLLTGGQGHVVGRGGSTQTRVDELLSWTRRHFPGAEVTHSWSAQDYSTHDHVPFVGRLPRGNGQVYTATGYGKWGMTNGVSAALQISGQILAERPPWSLTLGRRITGPGTLLRGVMANAEVGAELARGWSSTMLHSRDAAPAPEGGGQTRRRGGIPVAEATVDGQVCQLSAVCTHLGGIVNWNDAERTWDCPLHGSRFTADGAVLEGPATTPLKLMP